ncbi:MAG: DUF2800 domain-containing protein [Pontibacterium sp.]
MSAHARLGPSNHRWPHCPGSVREEVVYPDVSGDAAIDGTGSHLLLEMCVEQGRAADDFTGETIGTGHRDKPGGWSVKPDRAERVQMCLDYIRRRNDELLSQFPDVEIIIETETRADPGGMFGRTDWWGTVDITITVMQDDNCLFVEVIDYKDGRIFVPAEGNSQLISYMGGKLRPFIASGPDQVRPFKPEKVGACRMTIVQPKSQTPVRYWDTSPGVVLSRLYALARAAHETDKPDAPLAAGDHCKWCKHEKCTEKLKEAQTVMTDIITTDGTLFEQVQAAIADPASLTAEQLAQLADAREPLEAAFDAVNTEIERRIAEGVDVPGYAMKPGRGSKKWALDEEEIAKKLRSRKLTNADIFPPKLASPAQILKSEKLDAKQRERLEKDLITVIAGKEKLTRVRQKVEKDPSTLFNDVVPSSNKISFM